MFFSVLEVPPIHLTLLILDLGPVPYLTPTVLSPDLADPELLLSPAKSEQKNCRHRRIRSSDVSTPLKYTSRLRFKLGAHGYLLTALKAATPVGGHSEKKLTVERSMLMNPPAPTPKRSKERPLSPTVMRKVGLNPPPPTPKASSRNLL